MNDKLLIAAIASCSVTLQATACVEHSCEDLANCETSDGGSGTGVAVGAGGVGGSGTGAAGGSGPGPGGGGNGGDGGGGSPPSCVQDLSLGAGHSCAVKGDGTLWCWGDNTYGEIGDGTTQNKTTPVQIAALGSDVESVSLGFDHTCAVKTDGTLWCWGRNEYGQLGDGTTQDKTTPNAVASLGGTVDRVALGVAHSCAIRDDGSVECWGANSTGQLGDGTQTDASTPGPVAAVPTPVAAVDLGGFVGPGSNSHTCWLGSDTLPWCSGENVNGQLGDGTTQDKVTPLAATTVGSGVTDLALGSRHTCAVKASAVWCWGNNSYGQLGDGTTVNKSTPFQLPNFGGSILSVDASSDHSCALDEDGNLFCWGRNTFGSLGDGTTVNKSSPNVVSALATPVVTYAVGATHTCAIDGTDQLFCWGGNNSGALGDGTTETKTSPVLNPLCP